MKQASKSVTSRAKSNNNPSRTIPKKHWGTWILAPILIGIVAASVAKTAYIYLHSHIERGQFSVSDTYVGGNPARSLDLKVASQATYPSGPLSVTNDLGQVDGLHEQIFKFQVRDDNLTEYGLMMTPNSPPPAKGYPVVILLHGFINPRKFNTREDYVAEMELYASHGFMVLKPDLRGQGLSIDNGFADSAYYSMSYNIDVLSLISSLKQSKNVDTSNINLWGHSMGAYIALRAAVLSKSIRNIILLAGPVDSLEEMYLTYIPPSDENNPYALATRTEVFSKYGTPADNPNFWHDASPINFLSNIKGTVQIFVGLQDKVVPPIFSYDLNQALDKTKIKHQYYSYTDGGHSLGPQRPDVYSKSLQLLQSN